MIREVKSATGTMTYEIKSAGVMTCWINVMASISPSWMATIAEELGQKIASTTPGLWPDPSSAGRKD